MMSNCVEEVPINGRMPELIGLDLVVRRPPAERLLVLLSRLEVLREVEPNWQKMPGNVDR